jgi:hypothetical protein
MSWAEKFWCQHYCQKQEPTLHLVKLIQQQENFVINKQIISWAELKSSGVSTTVRNRSQHLAKLIQQRENFVLAKFPSVQLEQGRQI